MQSMKIYNVDDRDYFFMHTRKLQVLKKRLLGDYYLDPSLSFPHHSACHSFTEKQRNVCMTLFE